MEDRKVTKGWREEGSGKRGLKGKHGREVCGRERKEGTVGEWEVKM